MRCHELTALAELAEALEAELASVEAATKELELELALEERVRDAPLARTHPAAAAGPRHAASSGGGGTDGRQRAGGIGGGGGAPTPAVEQVADMLHRVLYKFFDEFHANEISLQSVFEACAGRE